MPRAEACLSHLCVEERRARQWTAVAWLGRELAAAHMRTLTVTVSILFITPTTVYEVAAAHAHAHTRAAVSTERQRTACLGGAGGVVGERRRGATGDEALAEEAGPADADAHHAARQHPEERRVGELDGRQPLLAQLAGGDAEEHRGQHGEGVRVQHRRPEALDRDARHLCARWRERRAPLRETGARDRRADGRAAARTRNLPYVSWKMRTTHQIITQ